MKANLKHHLPLLIPISLMIIIFLFSATPATQSSATSRPIADFIGLPEVIIRKSAHFTIYALLGASWYFYLRKQSKFTPAFTIFMSLLLALLYAILDEFHQTSVPGRSGLTTDILIDTAGAGAGIAIFATIYYLTRSEQHKKSRRKQIRHIWQQNHKLAQKLKSPTKK